MDGNLIKIVDEEFSTKNFKLINFFEGNTHLVYLIKIELNFFIIRISKKNHKKFRSEIWALKQFEKWNIPCTRLISFNDSKNLGDFNYFILTYVAGNHPKISNYHAFVSLSKNGLYLVHQKKIKKFGDINEKGIGIFDTWNEFLNFKFQKSFPNLEQNNVLTFKKLNKIKILKNKIQGLIQLTEGRCLLGDLHHLNFFVKNNDFYSFIDLKSVLSGDPLWDYALIYYYNNQFIWPTYIIFDKKNQLIFYFYCMLIVINKIWFNYKYKRNFKNLENKLDEYILKLEALLI